MTYKILSTRQIDVTLITTVEYDFNGQKVVVDIPHFMPSNEGVIIENIINASSAELIKLEARNNISNIINDLNIGEIKPL